MDLTFSKFRIRIRISCFGLGSDQDLKKPRSAHLCLLLTIVAEAQLNGAGSRISILKCLCCKGIKCEGSIKTKLNQTGIISNQAQHNAVNKRKASFAIDDALQTISILRFNRLATYFYGD